MPTQPKEILEKVLSSLGFPATVEEQKIEDGVFLDVKTDDAGRLIGRRSPDRGDEFVCAPSGAFEALGFCGVQAVSPAIFDKISEVGEFGITEAYLRLAKAREDILAYRVDGAKWRDCGRREDLRPF